MTNQEFFEIVACFDRSTAQTMKLSTHVWTVAYCLHHCFGL